ncbi:MAG TPA: response regulator transcription factor [Polyangia bacterium]
MRVVLISGEPAFRFGFRTVVETSGDLDLVADAADARSGFQAIDTESPDVVVMDVALGGMNGPSATREVKRRAPGARVLLLGTWPRERDVLEGFAAGADGFALKSDPVVSLIYAIRSVGHGNRFLTAAVRGLSGTTARAIQRSQNNGVAADVLDALSAREREVLDLVIKGWRNRDMARELCVSIKTIDTHRTRINRKLRCRNAAELIRFAADNGILRGSQPPPSRPRTIVLLVDNDPQLRAALLNDVRTHGYKESRAASVSSAIAAAEASGEGRSVIVIDPAAGKEAVPTSEICRELAGVDTSTCGTLLVSFDETETPGPALRAIAALPPTSEGDEDFFAALDRVMASRSATAAASPERASA